MTSLSEQQWHARAERLLEAALDAMRDEAAPVDDVFADAEAALVCLRIAEGEMAEDELDGYPFPGEDADESACICPADLVERGGFKGGCPVHANTAAIAARRAR